MDVDDAASAAAAAAVEEATECAAESPVPLLLLVPRVFVVVFVGGLPVVVVVPVGGFQLRKEVQILQGLPSGPRTMPGGSGGRAVGGKDEDCAVEGVSVLLELVPIVTPRQPRTRDGEVRLYDAQ